MISTNLVGQYVVQGWGEDIQYHPIVAVTVDRDQMTLWARNPDNIINSYNALSCKIARKPGSECH